MSSFGTYMLKRFSIFWLTTIALIGFMGVSAHAQAPSSHEAVQAHWHCSKHPASNEFELVKADLKEGFFDLTQGAPFTVGVSLSDLIDVYKGRRVLMGSRQLTACFIGGQHALNHSAHERVGLQWASLQQSQRRSAIDFSHVRMVQSESEMLQCIASYYPAVGYLSQPTVTVAVAPCF
jgi:hypothetical protein